MSSVVVVGLDDQKCMDYVRSKGFLLRGAVSAEATERFYEEDTPDVVVIDVTGLQLEAGAFLRGLRSRVAKGTSIIVISGRRRQEQRAALYAAGMHFFVPKSMELLEPTTAASQ